MKLIVDRQTDIPTNRPTDQQTDRRTLSHIELLSRLKINIAILYISTCILILILRHVHQLTLILISIFNIVVEPLAI